MENDGDAADADLVAPSDHERCRSAATQMLVEIPNAARECPFSVSVALKDGSKLVASVPPVKNPGTNEEEWLVDISFEGSIKNASQLIQHMAAIEF